MKFESSTMLAKMTCKHTLPKSVSALVRPASMGRRNVRASPLRARPIFTQDSTDLGVAGGANLLISGDRDLLAMAPSFKPPIVTAAAFLELVNAG